MNTADDQSATTPGHRPAPFYFGLALVTAAVLALEIVQTRMLSVVTWYHLAFFVISIAMFGMTLGALRVFLRPDRFARERLPRVLPEATFRTALAIAVSFLFQLCIAPYFAVSPRMIAAFFCLAATLAVPFYFAGVVVTLVLTRSPFPIGIVYGADLIGAAVGCVLVIPLLARLDGPGAVLACAAVMAGGAYCFALWSGRKPYRVGSLLLAVLMLAAAVANSRTYQGLSPITVKGSIEDRSRVVYERWNSFSRVTAYREETGPAKYHLWAASDKIPSFNTSSIHLNIDGLAGTSMFPVGEKIDSLGFLLFDVTSAAYVLRRGDVAVIGVGGGKDIVTALIAHNDSVRGIELNPAFVDIHRNAFRDYSRIADQPNVDLVADEARSYMTRHTESYDIIQASLIDTWASTGVGAFSLSENAIYTVDAFKIFLGRLKGNGVFTVSRWFSPDHQNETSRLLSLSIAALFELGVERPADHVILCANRNVATILLSVSPFSTADVEKFGAYVDRMDFQLLLAPGKPPDDPDSAAIIRAASLDDLRAITDRFPLDFSPPTDERPFFFNMLRLSRPWDLRKYIGRGDGVVYGNLIATWTLLVILCISLLFGLAILIVPFRLAPDGAQRPSGRALLYFALIGFGFMFAEIGFLQRLSIFLGHPTYSLSVVLFSLILFTGVGSMASDRLPITRRSGMIAYAIIVAGYLVGATYLAHWMQTSLQALSMPGRILLSVALIAPAGLAMGQAFPAGIRLAGSGGSDPTPWLWGVNGAAGVLASVIAVIVSIGWGITTNFFVAAACYGLLAVVGTSLIAAKK